MLTVYPFDPQLWSFVETAPWREAKTYASTWPHQYILKKNVPGLLFDRLTNHIYRRGYLEWFYADRKKYHHEDGWVYWYMARWPWEAELVNRCLEENTYSARMASGTLPTRKWR